MPACLDRLRELPTETAPPYDWAEFQLRAREGAKPTVKWTHAAVAAGIAAVVAGVALWSRVQPVKQSVEIGVMRADAPLVVAVDPQAAAQAEASERWLARLPVEPAVMRVGTRGAVTDLEDRIAWVDDLLSAERVDAVNPIHIVALQHERVRLVNSLAQVRYAETLAAEVP